MCGYSHHFSMEVSLFFFASLYEVIHLAEFVVIFIQRSSYIALFVFFLLSFWFVLSIYSGNNMLFTPKNALYKGFSVEKFGRN